MSINWCLRVNCLHQSKLFAWGETVCISLSGWQSASTICTRVNCVHQSKMPASGWIVYGGLNCLHQRKAPTSEEAFCIRGKFCAQVKVCNQSELFAPETTVGTRGTYFHQGRLFVSEDTLCIARKRLNQRKLRACEETSVSQSRLAIRVNCSQQNSSLQSE
jgi:hypothetical protein